MKKNNHILWIVYITTLLINCSIISGQEANNLQYDKAGHIKYIRFGESKTIGSWNIPSSSNEFFKNIMKVEDPNKFILKTKLEHKNGSYCEIYNQSFNDIKVEDGIFSLQFKNGKMVKANGHIVNLSGLSTTPALSPEEASKIYAKYLYASDTVKIKFLYGIVISETMKVSDKDTTYVPKLCYKIDLLNMTLDNGETGYIDANLGNVIKTVRRYCNSSATGTFSTLYNNTVSANTQNYNSTYNLCDSSRSAVIHTWDQNNTYYSYYESNRVEFTDADDIWTAAEHSSNNDQMALDIHWGLQKIFDYFYTYHNHFRSFDNNNHYITGYAHAVFSGSQPKDNAFWVRWANGYEAFYFGDGQYVFHPVASLDAVAHEYGHAITYHFTGLYNSPSDEMNAMNEGLSDIWGAVIEHKVEPSKSCWKIGEDIINVTGYNCSRNIETPESTTAHEIMADTYNNSIYNGTNSNYYTKSGIMSHWFFLLSQGGSGTNDNNNSYTVFSLGIDSAAKILLKAQTEDFTTVTSYADARTKTTEAAEDLYGSNSIQVMQVKNAWYAVGIGTQPTQMSITGTALLCPSGASYTLNNPATGILTWTSSANISIVSSQGSNPCTFQAVSNSNGSGWIQANFDGIAGPKINVWVGTPIVSVTAQTDEGYPNVEYWFEADTESPENTDPFSYSWDIYPYNGYISTGENGKVAYITFYEEYSVAGYQVMARAQNDCGTGDYGDTRIWIHEDWLLSPNPASETVTVTLQKSSISSSSNVSSSEDAVAKYNVSIIDIYGELYYSSTKSGASFTLPVNNLKNGNYIVRITKGKQTTNKQLIVKH